MRCSVCNKEWNIMEGDSKSVKCPYCGAIHPKGNISSISLNEAVKKIIDLYGNDILMSKGRFLSLLSDIAPRLVDERSIFSIALSENVASTILDDSISKSKRISIVQARLSNILAKTAIDKFVESIVYALDWPENIYVPLNNATVADHQHVNTPSPHDTILSTTNNTMNTGANSYQYHSNSISQKYISRNNPTVTQRSNYSVPNNSTTTNPTNSGTQKKGRDYLFRLFPTMVIGIVVIACVFIFVNGRSDKMNTQEVDKSYDNNYTSNNVYVESDVAAESEESELEVESKEKEESSSKQESLEGEYEENNEYILPNSNSAYISRSDLIGLSEEELRLARNEIFARHGRKFDDSGLQSYFNSCSWYHGTISPSDFDTSVLNIYEKANVDTIVNYETECGYR